jgi:rhamnosyltransferase subunit B
MKYLLVSVGTAGNAFPMVGIGRALQQRGHEVRLAALGRFRTSVESAGLAFHEITGVNGGSEYRDFWDPIDGISRVANSAILPAIRPVYELAASLDAADWTIVADNFSFGARVASEKTGVRLITCLVSPFLLRSFERIPATPGLMQQGPQRLLFSLVVRRWDRALGPTLNAFRDEVGLEPVRDIFYGWALSPRRVIGLFPEWFVARASDWPAQFVYGDFPRFDQGGSIDLPRELLAPGDPLVVFSAGSATGPTQAFYRAAVDASRGQRWRAVVLTFTTPAADLPHNVHWFDYVPLSRLLPLSAAVVHHGGIGSISMALASGTPQISVPFGVDQHENAAQVERLGAGHVLREAGPPVDLLSQRIEQVISDPSIRQRCGDIAAQTCADASLGALCTQIESDSHG